MALLGIAADGLGLVLAGLNVFFRELRPVPHRRDAAPFLVQPDRLRQGRDPCLQPRRPRQPAPLLERLGRGLVFLNPFDRFITASQWLVGQSPQGPGLWGWAIVVLFPVACLVLGYRAFRRMLPEVRDTL